MLVGLINGIIPVVAGIAIVVFFWGLVRYIYSAGDERVHANGKELITWGLLALFVLFSIWGILGLLQRSLLPSGNGGGGTPPAILSS